MMKKWMRQFCMLLGLVLFCLNLTGCGAHGPSSSVADGANGEGQKSDDKIKIVCTVYPAYEWTLQVLGDAADDYEVTWLLSKGTDIHNYQPSVADIAKIRQCDLFIYVGGESDAWAREVLASDMPEGHRSVVLMDSVGMALHEENDEGILQEEHDHEDHDTDTHDDSDALPEYDEHVWLSLRNASVMVDEIADEITELSGDESGIYLENAALYKEALSDLDARYMKTIGEAKRDTLIFADRFPFRYMAEDYGLKYFAAFSGCSAETEASFETLTSLAEKMDELDARVLMIIDGSDESLARTVISITKTKDQEVLMMDSLQAVTEKERANGLTYLRVMEDNLEVLGRALE